MKVGCQSVNRSADIQPAPASSAQATVPSQPISDLPDVPPQRAQVSVRLCDTDACNLRRQCAQTGMSAARYVSTLLAAVEEGRAQIAGKDAVEALAQSNYQLSWLGRNMRELLRKLDTSVPQRGGEVDALRLQEVIGLLNAHLLRASAVLADIETTRCPRRQRALRAASSPRAMGQRGRKQNGGTLA